MVNVGMKINLEGHTLEVTKIDKIAEGVTSISYVVKHGTKEITDGFIFVTEKENKDAKLKEVLSSIIKALKRIQSG